MIHFFLVLDREKSVGMELFNDGHYQISSELLISLIQTILLLGHELKAGKPKGELREVEIGDVQIATLEIDHLAYIVIQDTYDNEPFTKKTIEEVTNRYHKKLLNIDFVTGIPDEEKMKSEIAKLITTMKFPEEALGDVNKVIMNLQGKLPNLDTIFIADLDDGIIKVWNKGNGNVLTLLMEILSEIPFERSWIGESKLMDSVKIGDKNYINEAWLIHRIGLTDFCLLGRVYYNNTERNRVLEEFEKAVNEIHGIILQFLN